MIEEFIETNDLKAEIISFSTETPVSVAIKQKKFNPKYLARTTMYLSKEKDEYMVIASVGKEFPIEKLEEVTETQLLEMNELECLEKTGYKKHFVPPISVFGVRVIIDSALENFDRLIFPISSKKYMKILMEEIFSSNEDIIFEKLD